MLAYQHAYHAGNFADVHKHLLLFATIDLLLRKDSAITFVDTHAGRGLYPLAAAQTQKLQEYQHGIAPLWRARESLAEHQPLLRDWLSALDEAQPGRRLETYPGSPWWLAKRLRAQDRLRLFELHPAEHEALAQQPLAPGIKRLREDGLQGLQRMLPVSTPRLGVLIDPSYEVKTDYTMVAETLIEAARKVRHAVLLIWYPLLPAGRHRQLLQQLKDSGLRKLWRSELTLAAPEHSSHGMYGSGMLVLNPPWGLSEDVTRAMQAIAPLLGEAASHRADWWVGE
ncbi:23S rRNA (adenine(2030)-N(6))-methyltransferase RlmJ [Pistricoccus aurantiacus]|uniref:Ribosomal RNA large subunit methyltransferase J n=1 Tax=Pistricoccus aurantiacus TaxID=1883414 RepID=A0A5B8SUA2_9GAMM|nr:23S rRNA (adenine(2030)-N(6))-methyltransferase RlmJ [Pistricoccus aurantiacus]QEA38360.1 23S rRNA (adenine(2030)-N(6))-methyltransferase RlmJ [Pistricoccus aurantiacus]